MERKVYCSIGERCKCIKFKKEENVSDAECLRQALSRARATDSVLDSMMKNKAVVLQRNIPGRNRLIDLEEDDHIEDDSDITVLLVDLNPPTTVTVQPSTSASIREDTVLSIARNMQVGEVITLDVPNIADNDSVSVSPTPSEVPSPAQSNALSKSEDIQNDESDTDSTESPKASKRSTPSGPGSVPYPVRLPKLALELVTLRDSVGVYRAQTQFINAWSMHLSSITNQKPTKKDYLNYSMSIVAAYPELKGGKGGFGIVRQQLSNCIRNHKSRAKRKLESYLPKSKDAQPTKKLRTTAADMAAVLPSGNSEEMEGALKELEKLNGDADTVHLRLLQAETFSVRRTYIEKEVKRILDIVEKYPFLKTDSLVLHEFCLLKGWKENAAAEKFIVRVESMIALLGKYFEIEPLNEQSKADIVRKLYDTFCGKFKKNTPLITVQEAFSSTHSTDTVEGDSPRLVLYTMEGAVAAAFIVADTVKVKINDPSVSKAVACLLAAYYVWDTVYPKAYSNTLHYMDRETLGSIKDNLFVDKFIRDRDHRLSGIQ